MASFLRRGKREVLGEANPPALRREHPVTAGAGELAPILLSLCAPHKTRTRSRSRVRSDVPYSSSATSGSNDAFLRGAPKRQGQGRVKVQPTNDRTSTIRDERTFRLHQN